MKSPASRSRVASSTSANSCTPRSEVGCRCGHGRDSTARMIPCHGKVVGRASCLHAQLRCVEALRAGAVERLAALPEPDRLVDGDVALLQRLDDPVELALQHLERRVVRDRASPPSAPASCAHLHDRRPERAARELDVHPLPGRHDVGAAQHGVPPPGRSRTPVRASRAVRAPEAGRRRCRARPADARGAAAGAAVSRSRVRPSVARSRSSERMSAARARPRRVSMRSRCRSSLARPLSPCAPARARGQSAPRRGPGRRAGRGGRRRRAHVGGEVAERRVLLVADRGDDRHRRGRDRAHHALVAEREEVLDASAAAGQDDHLDPRIRGERGEAADDALGCADLPGHASRRRSGSRRGSARGWQRPRPRARRPPCP